MVLPVGGRKPGIPDRTGFELNTLFSGFDDFKTRTERFVDAFDPFDYGTVGSGDDRAAIQAAVDAAQAQASTTGLRQRVFLSRRSWELPGTTPVTVDGSHVHIVAEQGATLSAPNMSSAITFTGSRTSGVTTVTGSIAKGAYTFDVADGSGIKDGDVLVIRSTESFNPDRAVYTKAEFVEVDTVSGTTVTTLLPIKDDYDATGETVTVDVIDMIEDVGIENLDITGPNSDTTGSNCAQFTYCRDVRIHGATFRQGRYSGVEVNTCLDVDITECKAVDNNNTVAGNGIRIVGCERVLVESCRGRNNRHTVDTDKVTNTPLCRYITYRDITAVRDLTVGISTHGGGEHHLIEGCITIGCGGGIASRARHTTIDNCDVIGSHSRTGSYRHGLLLGDGAPHPIGEGHACTGLTITNCRIDITGATGTTYAIWASAPLNDAYIGHNRFKGFTSHGLFFYGDTARGTTFEDNTVDCTSQIGSPGDFQHGIYIAPGTSADGNNQRDLAFRRNRVISPLYSGIRIEGNPSDTTNRSGDIVFDHNVVTDFGVRQLDIVQGYWNRVHANCGTPGNTTALLATGAAPNITAVTLEATGTGEPENAVTAPPGSRWWRTDGGAGKVLYVKETGIASTGWVAVT